MKQIAFIPLTPLGESVLLMGELEELHRIYDPCEITVFAIPLIAELYGNFKLCDHVVVLRGGVHDEAILEDIPGIVYDAVINHGYEPWWSKIVRQIPHRRAYGMEECYRDKKECEELFDKWVSIEYWNEHTIQKYKTALQQMAEVIRLISPSYAGNLARLTKENYVTKMPSGIPDGRYVLFLPGTSDLYKIFPIAKFCALAKSVRDMGLEAVFAIGPQDEEMLIRLEASDFKVFNSLSLSELAGLICRAELVVGNDSGPMHFAASFDVRTIHLFSHSGADVWFPYELNRHRMLMPECGRRHGIKCGTCQRTCIGQIKNSSVLDAMAELLGRPKPALKRLAWFPSSDYIGDMLVWINHLEAMASLYAPCEITVFGSALGKEVLAGVAFVDDYVIYDEASAWSEEEVKSFGHFDAVFNCRYDVDSVRRITQLDHVKAYGFENVDIPESVCRQCYDAYIPRTRWDDFHFRRETSVTEQGSELIRLVLPSYTCSRVTLDQNTYVHDFSDAALLPDNRVVFVLGASDSCKHWGNANYFWLAELVKAQGMTPTFVLGPKEKTYALEIKAHGFMAFEDLNFEQIAAVFSRDGGARCVIGNDTGLMHLACILGAPSVTVVPLGMHYTWFPYCDDRRARHLCCVPVCAMPYCANDCTQTKSCVGKISREQVAESVGEVLGVELED